MKTKLKQYRRTIPADLETPVGIYLKVRDLYPQSALLESSDYHAQHNATSFIGVEPIGSFKVVDGEIVTTVPTAVGVRPASVLPTVSMWWRNCATTLRTSI